MFKDLAGGTGAKRQCVRYWDCMSYMQVNQISTMYSLWRMTTQLFIVELWWTLLYWGRGLLLDIVLMWCETKTLGHVCTNLLFLCVVMMYVSTGVRGLCGLWNDTWPSQQCRIKLANSTMSQSLVLLRSSMLMPKMRWNNCAYHRLMYCLYEYCCSNVLSWIWRA